MARPLGFVLLAALPLAGCASTPKGHLIPQATAPGTHKVEMMVATTRARDEVDPGVVFGGARAESLSFADIAISIPPDQNRQIGQIQWPDSTPADPLKDFATLRADIISYEQARTRFASAIRSSPNQRVLVFVHGFNNKFDEAVYRFAQVVHDSKAPAVPILFAWASKGDAFAYPYDRESASIARDGLEVLLTKLNSDPNVKEISILAHSMGNMAALEALRQIAIRHNKLFPKIRDVILAAPDVDIDVFKRQIAEIGNDRPPFTLIVSRNDEALRLSSFLWSDRYRVGNIDPNAPQYRELMKRDKLNVIDVTHVKPGDRFDHTTFAESPTVVRAIGKSVASGQPLSGSQLGLGEQVGTAAFGVASTLTGQ